MSVLKITAAVECDHCAAHFLVDMDPTITAGPEIGNTLADFVDEACVNGRTETKTGQVVDISPCSLQDGKQLCPKCTREFDEAAGDDE